MVAVSRRSICNRAGIGPTIAAAGLLLATPANAQAQQDVDRCAGKDGVSSEQQIRSCTALIESNTYTGRELAFAFNSRGLAYYDKRDFERAIASYNEAIRLDPKFAQGYNNRALAHKARGDLDRAIADYEAALRVAPRDETAAENLAAVRAQRKRAMK